MYRQCCAGRHALADCFCFNLSGNECADIHMCGKESITAPTELLYHVPCPCSIKLKFVNILRLFALSLLASRSQTFNYNIEHSNIFDPRKNQTSL